MTKMPGLMGAETEATALAIYRHPDGERLTPGPVGCPARAAAVKATRLEFAPRLAEKHGYRQSAVTGRWSRVLES